MFLKILALAIACTHTAPAPAGADTTPVGFNTAPIEAGDTSRTAYQRFAPPPGFERIPLDSASFGFYLRHFPLKAPDTPVRLYNGALKPYQDGRAAVLDIDTGKKDLQQCADAVMRLRAEYLYAQKRYSEIAFHFTSGFPTDFVRWAEGGRIRVVVNQCSWYQGGKRDYGYANFRAYMEKVFNYAGTLSLSRELRAVSTADIQPGDVFIKGGSPGHAVIVMDAAVEKGSNRRIFMLAQSYMPAQDIHILKNLNDAALSPWYALDENAPLYTPEWTFEKNALKRF